jgi:hypothetical protein
MKLLPPHELKGGDETPPPPNFKGGGAACWPCSMMYAMCMSASMLKLT